MLIKYLGRAAAVLAAALFSAAPAQAGELFLTPEDEPVIEVQAKRAESGPVLLFSDSPEMVYQKGVLYRDTVQGNVRLFFHHVNAMQAGGKKLAVLLQNKENLRPVDYRVTRLGLGDSAYNYVREGKQCQERYFDDKYQQGLQLPAGRLGFGRAAELLTGRGFILQENKLLTGTLELYAAKPLLLSVLFCEPQNALDLYSDSAPVLPQDEHPLRGTFPAANWSYTLAQPLVFPTEEGRAYGLCLASSGEGFAQGVDAATGLPAENYGNYGVLYKVSFTIDSPVPVRLQLNPLGGEFAGWGVLEDAEGRRTLLALPDGRESLGLTIEETVDIARLKSGSYSFIWSPPGAANLPVRLLWRAEAPQSMKERVQELLRQKN